MRTARALSTLDPAGMRALVDAVTRAPGGSVVIEGANDTVRRVWELAGYGAAAIPVEPAP